MPSSSAKIITPNIVMKYLQCPRMHILFENNCLLRKGVYSSQYWLQLSCREIKTQSGKTRTFGYRAWREICVSLPLSKNLVTSVWEVTLDRRHYRTDFWKIQIGHLISILDLGLLSVALFGVIVMEDVVLYILHIRLLV